MKPGFRGAGDEDIEGGYAELEGNCASAELLC